MRALLLAIVASAIGCGATGGAAPPTTGLVVAIQYDDEGIDEIAVHGAAAMSGREFGPYVVRAAQLPSGGTVGLVFAADDAGDAMVCAEARDDRGDVQASDCDQFDIRAGDVTHGELRLHHWSN
jgi:hypothetical protein